MSGASVYGRVFRVAVGYAKKSKTQALNAPNECCRRRQQFYCNLNLLQCGVLADEMVALAATGMIRAFTFTAGTPL